MKSSLFAHLIAASTLTLLTACGGTLPANKVHEAPKAGAQVLSDSTTEETNNAQLLKQMKLAMSDEQLISTASSKADLFFDISTWQNKKITTSTEFQQLLDQVAKSAIDQQKSTPQNLVAFWPKLSSLIDQLCNDDLKNCSLMTSFKTSAYSAELLKELALQQTSIDKKYKYFFIGFDLQNQNFPAATVEAFLSGAKQYRERLMADINALTKTQASQALQEKQALLAKMNSTLSLLVSLVQEGKIQTANTDWIRDLNLTSSFKESDVKIAAQYIVYEKGTRQLTKEIKAEIAKLQSLPGSFSLKRKMVLEKNPKIFQTFEVKNIELDEYFYAIDQVYTSRWSLKQGDAFVKGAALSTDRLLEVAQNYLRFDVVYLITLSQGEFKDFVRDHKSVSPTNIINFAKKVLSRSSIETLALPEKAQKISQLVSMAAGTNSKESNLFLKQVSTLQKTFKTTITYPYMMVILYFASRMGLTADDRLEVTRFSGDGNPKLILFIKNLFLGTLIPILDYTSDVVALNAQEVLESIELSAKTGLYENIGLSMDDVMSELFNILAQEKVNRLAYNQANLDEKYTPAEWTDLMYLCQGIKNGNPQARNIGLTEMVASPTLGSTYSRLRETFTGQSGRVVDGITLKDHGYFLFSTILTEELEWIRSDLFNVFQYFDVMQTTLKASSGLVLPKLNKQIESLKAQTKKFLTDMKKREGEFDQCYFTIISKERSYINQIVSYEVAYWKLAYQEIKKIRAGKPAADLGANYLGLKLPAGVEYRSTFSEKGATSHGFDFLLRAKSFLKNGLPQAGLPPINPELNIVWTKQLEDQDLYKNSRTNLVSFSESQEEFVRSAVAASNIAGNNQQVFWFYVTYMQPSYYREYYDSKAVMYRMSSLATRLLKMDTLVTADELMQTPLRVISFISQSADEQQTMKTLGITTRYSPESLRSYNIFYDRTNENAAPLYDYLLTSLSQKWMATFGHIDQYEDIKTGNFRARPQELVPIITLAEGLFLYNSTLDDNLFSSALKTPAIVTATYRETIENDFKLLRQARAAIAETAKKSSNQMSVNFNANETLPLTYVSRQVFDNVESYINSFNNRTGGFYNTK